MEAVWPRKPSDFAFSQDGGDDDERDVSFDGHGDGVAAAGGGGGRGRRDGAVAQRPVDAATRPARSHRSAADRRAAATAGGDGRPHLEAFSLPFV